MRSAGRWLIVVALGAACGKKDSDEHPLPAPEPSPLPSPGIDAAPPPAPIAVEVQHPDNAAAGEAIRTTLLDAGLVADPAGAVGTLALACKDEPGTVYNGGAVWIRQACDVTLRDPAGETRLAWSILGPDGGMMVSGDVVDAALSSFLGSPELSLLPALARAVLDADATVVPIGDLGGAVGVLARLLAPAELAGLEARVGKDAGFAALYALGERGATDALAAARVADASLPDQIGMEDGDPDRVLALEAAAAMPALDDTAPIPVALDITLAARGKTPLVDVRAHLQARFYAAGLDPKGAAPVAKITVKCKEKKGPTFEGTMFGQTTKSTWTRVTCAMKVAPAKGKAASLTIDARTPMLISGDVDDAARAQFLESAGLAALPEAAAVILGRPRRAAVLASLAVGFAREQDVGPIAALLAPHLAKLSPALRACVLVARRKFGDLAALGDAALPALWALLTSDWGTAETTQLFDFDRRAEDVVRARLPAVKALAAIGGARAGVLAGLVAQDLPVDEEGEDTIFTHAGSFGAGPTTFHPAAEEGALLAVLLGVILETDPAGSQDVLAKFASDHRKKVQAALQ